MHGGSKSATVIRATSVAAHAPRHSAPGCRRGRSGSWSTRAGPRTSSISRRAASPRRYHCGLLRSSSYRDADPLPHAHRARRGLAGDPRKARVRSLFRPLPLEVMLSLPERPTRADGSSHPVSTMPSRNAHWTGGHGTWLYTTTGHATTTWGCCTTASWRTASAKLEFNAIKLKRMRRKEKI